MTVAQFCAALLFVASLELPFPEFHRHYAARRVLLQSMRGVRS